jgi:transcriptional regulator with XRE-family HTH domain
VRSIRRKLNVSQPVFAARMNIPTVTAASWERGRRKPTGAALRLLDIARKHPEVLLPVDAAPAFFSLVKSDNRSARYPDSECALSRIADVSRIELQPLHRRNRRTPAWAV